ncbi:hypothetical protein HF086_000338, partial [Spodoptera exigua]
GRRNLPKILRPKLLNHIIQKRKYDLKNSALTNFDDDVMKGKFKPILDLLLHLSDEQNVLSDDDIRHHLDTFVFGAYDTTFSVLLTILLVLGSHADVQERVYDE